MPVLSEQNYIPKEIVDDAGLSSYYKIWIYSSISGGIVGYLPETFDVSVESEWQAPFEQPGVGTLESVAQVAGISTKFVHQSRMMWAATRPLQMTLPITFFARNNAEQEVMEPCKKLQRLCLPSLSKGGLGNLIPPGPIWDLLNAKKSRGDQISIQLGNMYDFNPVVFTNVSVTIHTILSPEGHSMKGIANTSIMTAEILTKDRI